jgi:lipoprotein-anchoring transpeptidase ErfK/SrfK
MILTAIRTSLSAAALVAAVSTSAFAGPLPLFPFDPAPFPAPRAAAYAPVEVEEQAQEPAVQAPAAQSRFKRQVVSYPTHEAPGTIVIDTPNTYLYLVLGDGKALRYGIGVGREGFTWAGTKSVEKKAEWPDWHPPQEMLQRQPYLPRMMAGGPGNPLGARAMYLSGSVYRIHGTNAPSTIGQRVSSGCIRLTNEDVTDLYNRVKLGARVVVLPMTDHRITHRTGFSTN